MKALFGIAIVQNDIKTAGHCNDKLMQPFMGMSAPLGPARHVIEIVDPADVERHMLLPFDKGQVAARVGYFRQLNDVAPFQAHDSSR